MNEMYKEHCSCKPEYEIKKELEAIHNAKLSEIGADIRNKLGPMKNLLSMIDLYNRTLVMEQRTAIWKFIEKEIEKSKESINYISNIL